VILKICKSHDVSFIHILTKDVSKRIVRLLFNLIFLGLFNIVTVGRGSCIFPCC
jgi:hypothetical protein